MTDPQFRPVVAIDMDGVLRVPVRSGGHDPDQVIANITFRRDAYPTLHHSQPPWNSRGRYTDEHGEAFSRVGVEWVQDLLRRGIDVVWATTWQQHANTYFAPVLGLPELPIAVSDDRSGHDDPGMWKAAQLATDSRWAGRPLAWVDDAIPSGRKIEDARRPKDRALTLSFRVGAPWDGIRAWEVAELDAWLALASTAAGHVELRRRRAREVRSLAAARRREWEMAERRWRWEGALEELLPDHHDLAVTLARITSPPPDKLVAEICRRHGVDGEVVVENILRTLRSSHSGER
ncbi:hypothetical protein [Microbacterium sp. NPDC079995]|uniref:hypothetical protein n=1 Tax=unclassified Microbacterium TaxID=2609290 RepID=UPI003450F48E